LLAGRRCAGFTLLELMVVVVLIGIIFSFAVLSMGGDDMAGLMERETRRLVTVLDMAGSEAVLQGEELAVYFSDTSYEFLVLEEGDWQPTADSALLGEHILPAGISIRLEVDGDPPGLTATPGDAVDDDESNVKIPQVYVLSSGEMTPFSATLESAQSIRRYHLSATILGELTWELEELL